MRRVPQCWDRRGLAAVASRAADAARRTQLAIGELPRAPWAAPRFPPVQSQAPLEEIPQAPRASTPAPTSPDRPPRARLAMTRACSAAQKDGLLVPPCAELPRRQ